MTDLPRREVLKLAGTTGAIGAAGATRSLVQSGQSSDTPTDQPDRGDPDEYEHYSVRRVAADGSEEYDTIQAAVEDALPRDLILVEPGVYNEQVTVQGTPRLTIRGTDRNEVILDGEFERRNGVEVLQTDHVVVENMTARHYRYNGFFWTGVDGYRGSYLTAYNNGDYGVYAFSSVNGKFEHSYASGHPDSGFYIGQCKPCHAVVDDVVAENNAIGYSGTNAGGYLTIKNSEWKRNMSGIVPNTLDSENLAPQEGARIENNDVHDNANPSAPAKKIAFPVFGTGIAVTGGANNEVFDNAVADHANFGILIAPIYDKNLWTPAHNEVRGNTVSASGRADLALATPTGGGNCFADNDFSSSRPANIEGRHGCDGGNLLSGISPGDIWPTLTMVKGYVQANYGSHPSGDWKSQPAPGDRPGMDDPDRPPRAAVGDA